MLYNVKVFNLQEFIRTFSYIGIFMMIFAESGLLIGILLPGDSLLFVSGFLASQHLLNLPILITVVFVAAVLGDNVGYQLGKYFGPNFFNRPGSRFLKPHMIEKSKKFYKKHGGKTVILSRFTPFVRTLAPPLAGVADMEFRMFFIYNLIGAALWSTSVILLGYFLGQAIPNIDHYLLPAVGVVIVVSLVPSAWHFWRERQQSK